MGVKGWQKKTKEKNKHYETYVMKFNFLVIMDMFKCFQLH
jgi:hypothetical protein